MKKSEIKKDRINEIKRVWGDLAFKGKKLAPHDLEILPLIVSIAKQADKILDVGAGDGRWIDVLKREGIKAEFYAVDITDKVKEADANSIIGDARMLPFKDESFDFVYSIGVIEHFPESLIAVREHARVTKKGGYVFMIVPHLSPATIRRYIKWILKERKKGSFETVVGRNMRVKELKELCENAQLKIIDLGCYGYVYMPILNLSKTFREKVKKIFGRWMGDFIYVLAKK